MLLFAPVRQQTDHHLNFLCTEGMQLAVHNALRNVNRVHPPLHCCVIKHLCNGLCNGLERDAIGS